MGEQGHAKQESASIEDELTVEDGVTSDQDGVYVKTLEILLVDAGLELGRALRNGQSPCTRARRRRGPPDSLPITRQRCP